MRNYENQAKFEDLKGKTIDSILGLEVGSEQALIHTTDGKQYQMVYHHDCCASCNIDEIHGDVADLIGSEILLAEEVQQAEGEAKKNGEGEYVYVDESFTWTFYKLSTIKGSVTIKWYGSSNGYYSESATFEEVAS